MALTRGWRERLGLYSEAAQSYEIARSIRHEVHLAGVVSEVIVVPRGATFDLVVSLDGESTALVWWGREAIAGVALGTFLSAHGRPGLYKNQSALLNPKYELGIAHG